MSETSQTLDEVFDTDAPAAPPGTLIELDFGDAEFVVRKHPDGMITIDMPEPRLILNAEQFGQLLHAMHTVGQLLHAMHTVYKGY